MEGEEKKKKKRDFLLHLEAYLAKRDGVDKLLKISRYAAKLLLSSGYVLGNADLAPRLKAFESSVGLSRKAFRLGKFVQDLNALRSSAPDQILPFIAYGGEGIYYFVEQFVWLCKAGLISPRHSKRLQKISAWAELVGYAGSVAMKIEELKKIQLKLRSSREAEELRGLREKMLVKRLSIVQDLADALMAIGDVRDGRGVLSGPFVVASAGLLSALISARKNWSSC
ncbi:peroxin 11A [Wolffia australiana]